MKKLFIFLFLMISFNCFALPEQNEAIFTGKPFYTIPVHNNNFFIDFGQNDFAGLSVGYHMPTAIHVFAKQNAVVIDNYSFSLSRNKGQINGEILLSYSAFANVDYKNEKMNNGIFIGIGFGVYNNQSSLPIHFGINYNHFVLSFHTQRGLTLGYTFKYDDIVKEIKKNHTFNKAATILFEKL